MFRKHRTTILLILILILAAFLRLHRIGEYMTFLGDEGRDLLAVKSILSGDLVFLGPRSSAADFYYGPIYFYFITPFLWLFQYDPVGPAVFIALTGIATVYLVYFVGKKLFSEATGIFAAALYTVSPIVIAYSRSSWNPNPLPFISLVSLYTVYEAVRRNSYKLFLITGILMGIAIQLQYLALFLFVIIFLFILIGFFLENKKKELLILVKQYAVVGVGYIIGWAPFLAFEVKNGFPNLRTIFNFVLFGTDETVYPDNMGFTQNIASVFFKLYGRLVTRFPAPEQVNINEDISLRIWQIATFILGFVSIYFLFKVKNKLTMVLFILWLSLGCFLFGFYKKAIYDYYLGFIFPLPFLLIGNGLGSLWNTSYKNKLSSALVKLGVLAVFFALFIFNLYANPFQYQPNRQKDQVQMISEFVMEKAGGEPYNFALLTKGNSDHAYRYFFEINNQPPTEIKNVDIDPERTSVTEQLLIVCEYTDCQPLGDSLWEVAGFGRAEIAGEWQVSVVKIYRLIHYKEQ